MELHQRSILITGGTSGIGLALVRQLAPCNKGIIVLARDQQKLDALTVSYPNVIPYICALDQQHQLIEQLALICTRHPEISVVINNAAVQFPTRLTDEDFNIDSIATEVATNFTAPMQISSTMLKPLMAQKKSAAIVNINSGLAYFPKTGSAVYCATKAGLHNFSVSLGYQLERTKIKVMEVILPLVDTPMTQGRGSGKITAEQAVREIIKGIELDKTTIYVGKAKWIPLLTRLVPGVMAKIMKNA
jgi:uncharacterized oxidoreductase